MADDILTGGTPTADSNDGSGPELACDNNEATRWNSTDAGGFPHWWKYDLGASVSKTVRKLRFMPANDANVKDFTLQGSNNDSTWTTIYTGQGANSYGSWQEFTFTNANAYRYYKINCTSNWRGDSYTYIYMFEIEMMEVPTGSSFGIVIT